MIKDFQIFKTELKNHVLGQLDQTPIILRRFGANNLTILKVILPILSDWKTAQQAFEAGNISAEALLQQQQFMQTRLSQNILSLQVVDFHPVVAKMFVDNAALFPVPKDAFAFREPEMLDPLGMRTEAARHEFKRQLMFCQDALELGDYANAYETAEKIRNTIEPESPYVYEYLLISFFKMHGSAEILKDFLQKNGDKLKHIQLYVKRVRNLDSDDKEKVEIISQIGSELMTFLYQKYQSVTYNYVATGSFEESPQRKLVFQILEMGTRLASDTFKGLPVASAFVKMALLELEGGGQFDWLGLEKDGFIKNLFQNYDVLSLRTALLKADIETPDEQGQRPVADRLYFHLMQKYYELPLKMGESEDLEVRLSVIRCLQTARLGMVLYGEDRRFSDFALAELLGENQLKWLTTDVKGLLATNKACKMLDNYPALTDLQQIAAFAGRAEEVTGKLDKIQKEANQARILLEAKEDLEIVDKNYQKLRKNANIALPETRMEIKKCLDAWTVANDLFETKDLAEKVLQELTGLPNPPSSVLTWLDIDAEGQLDSLTECKKMGYDAVQVARRALRKAEKDPAIQADRLEMARMEAAKRAVARTNRDYDRLKTQSDSETTRRDVINCLEKWRICATVLEDDTLLKKCIDELTGDGIITWFEIGADGKLKRQTGVTTALAQLVTNLLSKNEDIQNIDNQSNTHSALSEQITRRIHRNAFQKLEQSVMADWADDTSRDRLAAALGKCEQAYYHLPFADKADFASLAKDILLKNEVLANFVRQKAGLTADGLFTDFDEMYPAIREMNASFAALIAPPVELPPLPTVAKPIIAPVAERSLATPMPPQPPISARETEVSTVDLDWNMLFILEGVGLMAALIADRPFSGREVLGYALLIMLLNWGAYWMLYRRQPPVIQQVMKKFRFGK
jgi:hypothetical protein